MFTEAEQKKLLKIKGILNETWDGKLKKYHLTMTQAYEIEQAYNQIVKGNTVQTISERVKDFFEKYGLWVRKEGIGWIIKLK